MILDLLLILFMEQWRWRIVNHWSEKKDKGDFIAGFTSNKLCEEKVGEEQLIYIMKVTEKLSYKSILMITFQMQNSFR